MADDRLYDGLLMRVLALTDYDQKLSNDPKRRHVLQRYFDDVPLNTADCVQLVTLAQRHNQRLKTNHGAALNFIRSARANPSSALQQRENHRRQMWQFDAARSSILAEFRNDLRSRLPATTFQQLENAVNTRMIASGHNEMPRIGRPAPLR